MRVYRSISLVDDRSTKTVFGHLRLLLLDGCGAALKLHNPSQHNTGLPGALYNKFLSIFVKFFLWTLKALKNQYRRGLLLLLLLVLLLL